MASISYRAGSKQPWRVRYRDPQGRSCSKQFSTKQDATEFFADIQKHEERKTAYKPDPICEPPSFAEIAERYLESRAIRNKGSTVIGKAKKLQVFLQWAEINEESVFSKQMLERYYAYATGPTGRWGQKRETCTANRLLKEVFLLWEWAEQSEIWGDMIPRPRRVEIQKPSEKITVSPTWEEMDACIRNAKGWCQKLLIFLRFTGLRVGESLQLKQEHLDVNQKTLHIPAQFSKTGIGRVVPIHPDLVAYLVRWAAEASPYLLPCERSITHEREPRARDTARAWARTIAAGEARPILSEVAPNHGFRRGFKTGLLSLGANPDAVDYLQGHQIQGSRRAYIDPLIALPLRQTLDLIPPLKLGRGLIVAYGKSEKKEDELESIQLKRMAEPEGFMPKMRKR